MKTNLFIAITISIISYSIGYAQSIGGGTSTPTQELPDIIGPSPTVSSLMSFEEVPVSHYSGQPDISIPIFSKALNKDLSINLALRYNTSGLRIDERSGWTGTGWALDAGGAISRTVRDLPDEINSIAMPINQTLDKSLGVYHNDFFDYDDMTFQQQAEFNWNARGGGKDNYDGNNDNELDLYQFSILGATGRFVIIKNSNNTLEAKILSRDQKLKIDLDYNTTTYHINSFTVTDAMGYKYIFDAKEESESIPVNIGTSQNGENFGLDIDSFNFLRYVSAWKMTKITTSNDKVLVDFYYADVNEAFDTPKTRTTNRITNLDKRTLVGTERNPNPEPWQSYNNGILKPKETYAYSQLSISTKKLQNITFRDGVSIDFVLVNGHPEYSGGAKLSDVIINETIGSSENKRYHFNYFENNSTNKRLFLSSIEERAGGQTLDYVLTYNTPGLLKGFGNTTNKDFWGYYKDAFFKNSGSADKTRVTTGVLKSITYPTGGKKEFIFESNTYAYEGSRLLTTEEFYSNPDNVNNQISNFNLSYSNNGLPQTILLQIDHDQTITFNSTITSGAQYANDARIRLSDANGVIRDFNLDTQDETVSLSSGNYTLQMEALVLLNNNETISTNSSIYYTSLNSSGISQLIYGGGLRIKEILFTDGSVLNPEKRIQYSYNEFNNSNRSSGAVDGFLKRARTHSRLESHYLNFSSGYSPTGVRYDVTQHLNDVDVTLTKNSYVGYKNVEVSETNNGHTKYTFSSPQDYPSYPSNYTYPYLPVEDITYKHGLQESKVVYDNSNRKLIEETSSYSFTNEIIASSMLIYESGQCVWTQFYNRYDAYLNKYAEKNELINLSYNNCSYIDPSIGYSFYNHNAGRAYLNETIRKEYFYDALNTQTVTETRETFEYDASNYQVSNQHIYFKEKGVDQHYQTKYFYPLSSGGYPSSGLAGIHKINCLVAQENYKDGDLISTVYNSYNNFGPNLVLLNKIKTREGEIPDPNGGLPSSVTEGTEDRIVYHSYDEYGNPLEISQADGSHIVYLWGYNKNYPVAKIENATYSQVLATGVNLTILNGLNYSNVQRTTELNKVRNGLPNALVSTYTYEPLIGILSMIDSRGYKTTYEYDSFNRLEFVRDGDGKILSKNVYNYKN